MKKPFLLITFLIGSALLFDSCKPDSLKDCDTPILTPCGVDTSKANVRVKNITDYDFCNVDINSNGSIGNFGIVHSGDSTCYVPFNEVYPHASVQFKIGKNDFSFTPIDYVGEVPGTSGNFTYTLDITNFAEGDVSIVRTAN